VIPRLRTPKGALAVAYYSAARDAGFDGDIAAATFPQAKGRILMRLPGLFRTHSPRKMSSDRIYSPIKM